MSENPISTTMDTQGQRVISPDPHLPYIEQTLELLRPIENDLGEEINWKELHKEVKPWANSLELADHVREAVRSYIALKIPRLKERIPSFQDLKTIPFLDALVHNWVEEELPEIKNQRREILLAVTAQIVKRMESLVYRKTLANLSDEELRDRLGLDPSLRQLLIDLLDTCQRADPLFIRFLAFSFLTPKAHDAATPTAIYLPGDAKPHTIAELFPHESLSISRNFQRIAENSQTWEGLPGADTFRTYLQTLSNVYSEINPQKAKQYVETSEQLYAELINSEFPIILSSGMTEGSYFKPPYIDPELKVSISTSEAREEESLWRIAQQGMMEGLEVIGAAEFAGEMGSRVIRGAINIGGHGANLIFNNVADGEPGITVFLNDQIRAYDRDFPEFMGLITNFKTEFSDQRSEEGRTFMERMSRSNTVHHELAHSVYKSSLPEAERLGDEPSTTIDEVKAEILYRPLIPKMLEAAALTGTKQQWAIGMLSSSMQQIRDKKEDDWYYYSAVYTLNELFTQGVLKFNGSQLTITDFNKFYEVNTQLAKGVLELYRDTEMTEQKAALWLKNHCHPNQQTKILSDFLKNEFKLSTADATH